MSLKESQRKALLKIADIAEHNQLGIEQIAYALNNPASLEARKDPARGKHFIVGLLTYLGGALIVAGYSIYVSIVWDEIGSLPRVILTLGVSLVALAIAISVSRDSKYSKAATPLFIFALLSEPGGMFILLKEYSSGNDALLASVIVFGVMALQSSLFFLTLRRTSLLFFALLYGLGWYGCALEYFHINEPMLWMAAGVTYLYLGWRIHNSGMKAVAPLTLVAGQAMLLSGLYYYLGNTDADILLVTIILSMFVWALFIGSKSLVITSLLFFVNLAGKYFFFCTSEYEPLVYTYTAMGASISMLLMGHWVKKHFTRVLSPVWYFFGSFLLYASGFELVADSPYDILFPILPGIMLYTALQEKSRTLLGTAIFALLIFIGYYTTTYFSDVIGWPLVLMGMGALVIMAGIITYKTSATFKQT